jgi:hypothetical protein
MGWCWGRLWWQLAISNKGLTSFPPVNCSPYVWIRSSLSFAPDQIRARRIFLPFWHKCLILFCPTLWHAWKATWGGPPSPIIRMTNTINVYKRKSSLLVCVNVNIEHPSDLGPPLSVNVAFFLFLFILLCVYLGSSLFSKSLKKIKGEPPTLVTLSTDARVHYYDKVNQS